MKPEKIFSYSNPYSLPIFVSILATLLCCTLFLWGQTNSFEIPRKTDAKKGTIYFFNGETTKFETLSFIRDTVFYTDLNGNMFGESLTQIHHIDKRATSPGKAAAIGGVAGLVVGFTAGSIAYPDRSFGEWLIDEINGDEHSHDLKKEEIPIIVGCTLGVAAIGALIGTNKKEKTIFKNDTSINVFPEMSVLPGEPNVFSMTVVIHIH